MEENKKIKFNLTTVIIIFIIFIAIVAGIAIYFLTKTDNNIINPVNSNNKNTFNIYDFKYEEGEYKLDLDGDGTKEEIELTKKGEIKINGKKTNAKCEQLFILDLNEDNNLEIITRMIYGTVDPQTSEYTIYNYYNNTLIQASSESFTGNIPEEVTVENDILKFDYYLYESNNVSYSVEMPLNNFITNPPEIDNKISYSENLNVVASLDEEITSNSMWCATFQLVWNDMINNVVKQDVEFIDGDDLEEAQTVADSLNLQSFKEDQLSDDDYYKVYDLKTLELKEKIETAIKEKFNETSDVLDDLDWSSAPKDNSGYNGKDTKTYIFYTMLKKVFNFENDFEELEDSSFAGKYEDVKYFGINSNSNSDLYSQVEVLYYNDVDDFAVVLKTKEGEDVILARGLKGNTFSKQYDNLKSKEEKYEGNKEFTENDYLKVPNINVQAKKNYDNLCDKRFLALDGDVCNITKAIQTINLDMNKSGGKIKSEAVIEMTKTTLAVEPEPVENRYFYLTDTFTMFLKENDKDLPYYAAYIEDISLFQDIAHN